jgi:hypothetical protein
MSPFASISRLLIPALPDSTVVTLESRATDEGPCRVSKQVRLNQTSRASRSG